MPTNKETKRVPTTLETNTVSKNSKEEALKLPPVSLEPTPAQSTLRPTEVIVKYEVSPNVGEALHQLIEVKARPFTVRIGSPLGTLEGSAVQFFMDEEGKQGKLIVPLPIKMDGSPEKWALTKELVEKIFPELSLEIGSPPSLLYDKGGKFYPLLSYSNYPQTIEIHLRNAKKANSMQLQQFLKTGLRLAHEVIGAFAAPAEKLLLESFEIHEKYFSKKASVPNGVIDEVRARAMNFFSSSCNSLDSYIGQDSALKKLNQLALDIVQASRFGLEWLSPSGAITYGATEELRRKIITSFTKEINGILIEVTPDDLKNSQAGGPEERLKAVFALATNLLSEHKSKQGILYIERADIMFGELDPLSQDSSYLNYFRKNLPPILASYFGQEPRLTIILGTDNPSELQSLVQDNFHHRIKLNSSICASDYQKLAENLLNEKVQAIKKQCPDFNDLTNTQRESFFKDMPNVPEQQLNEYINQFLLTRLSKKEEKENEVSLLEEYQKRVMH